MERKVRNNDKNDQNLHRPLRGDHDHGPTAKLGRLRRPGEIAPGGASRRLAKARVGGGIYAARDRWDIRSLGLRNREQMAVPDGRGENPRPVEIGLSLILAPSCPSVRRWAVGEGNQASGRAEPRHNERSTE